MYTQCYDDLIRSLREGKTNFAFLPLYPEDEYIRAEFDITVLFEEDFLLVLPVGHSWTNRKVIYCRDLHNENILLPQSLYLQQYISAQLEQQRVKVRFLQMSNFEMIKQAVKSELGIAFLPSQSVVEDINNGKLITKAVSSLSIKRKNGYVTRKHTPLNSIEMAFCKDVQQYFHGNKRSLTM
ncbi:LysR family transcriptional regulator substrate-binding protein [Paenibacillus foliorum]|uniref:LysR family transcriptional regulator substrate-binding protein n=1 Tax=Paenibacillus foliorum TaxID=2654974 RepID=UPI0028A727A1|nr:LysR family transcriptional regulator substrate-binding protein [Paenibacillus foliorum]